MVKLIASPLVYKRRFERWTNQRMRSHKLQNCRFRCVIYFVFAVTIFFHYLITKSKIWKIFRFLQLFAAGYLSLQVVGHFTASLWLRIRLPKVIVTEDQADFMHFDDCVENVKVLREADIIAAREYRRARRMADRFDRFQAHTPRQLRNNFPLIKLPIVWKPPCRRKQVIKNVIPEDTSDAITTHEEFDAWMKKKEAEELRERKVRQYREQLQREYMMIPRTHDDSYFYTGVYCLATIDLPPKKPEPPLADFQYPDHHSIYVNVFKAWFSKNILHTLIFQIDCLNDALKSYCFNQSIGNLSLHGLAVLNSQESNHRYLPYLRTVTMYLQAYENQPFLMERIRDLARGDSLEAFNNNTKLLNERFAEDYILPTDASILFYIFCVYMDMQLTGLDRPYEPLFSNKYVAYPRSTMANDMIECCQNRKVGILCTDKMRPKFHFILNQQLHTARNKDEDIFLVIIQFLDYVRKYCGGLLDGLNLGHLGINILSIFDK